MKGGLPMRKSREELAYENEDGFYTEEEIETLLEDDEISASEEGFMRGYIDA
ncbi:MAG: hypothetical protein AABX72_02900 [Nanoarchaeota archaeon]